MPDPLILRARDGDVVTLTFNDPARLNAMTEAMGEAFRAAITELAADASLRALVLTGAGRAFSAGGDFAMIEARAAQGAANGPSGRGRIRDGMRAFYQLFLSVREVPCPVIAAINGACDRRRPLRGARLRRPDRRQRRQARPQLHAARAPPGDGRDLDAAAAGGRRARRRDPVLEPASSAASGPPRSAW